MKYRFQATVHASQLPALIAALFQEDTNFDPELKIYRIEEPVGPAPAPVEVDPYPAPVPVDPDFAEVKPALKQRSMSKDDIVEEELKTGPKRWSELRDALSAHGFPNGSVTSAIRKREKEGTIRHNDGLWSLPE